jgi:hypothetical protein
MIGAIAFGSCYVYSPGGVCPVSRRSRALCALLKAGDASFLLKYALRVRREASECELFGDFFSGGAILIPVPTSVPPPAGSTCVAERLATAFVRQGLGSMAWPGLKRVRAVRKSATAPAGARPTVADHYHSFAVDTLPVPPARILLVDDVVTRGRTLLAAAARVHEAFPTAQIRAFALLRTMGLVAEIDRLLLPCVGEIRWRRGDARRNP